MTTLRNTLIAAASATIALMAAGAAAAQVAEATNNVAVNAEVVQALVVDAGDPLNFGRVARTDGTAGTVVVTPGGTRTVDGGLATAGGTVNNAKFTLKAEPSTQIKISLTKSVSPATFSLDTLTATGCNLTDADADAVVTGTTGSGGSCDLAVGGTLHVPAGTTGQTVTGSLIATINYQ